MREKTGVSLSEAIENVLGYDEMISLAREFYFDGYGNLASYETWSDWFDDMVNECDFKEWLIDNDHIAGEDIEAEMYCD